MHLKFNFYATSLCSVYLHIDLQILQWQSTAETILLFLPNQYLPGYLFPLFSFFDYVALLRLKLVSAFIEKR